MPVFRPKQDCAHSGACMGAFVEEGPLDVPDRVCPHCGIKLKRDESEELVNKFLSLNPNIIGVWVHPKLT